MRLRTVYGGEFNDEHAIIHWFWDILSDMHNFEKRDFLRFVTGVLATYPPTTQCAYFDLVLPLSN